MVDVRELWRALCQLTVGAIVYLGLIAIFMLYVSALKWGLFLEALGAKVSVFRLFNLYLLGYFVNLILPSYLGGDAVRSWYLGRSIGQHQAFAATIMERYTGLVGMVLMALTCMWFVESVGWPIKVTIILIALGLFAITVLALSPKMLAQVERIPKLRGTVKHLKKVQEGLLFVSKDRALLVKTMVLSLLYHVFTVVNTHAAAFAVGWSDPSLGGMFVVVPLILLIGAIPLAPNSLGIQEGAFYFFLTGLGGTPAQALGVGVILRIKTYIFAMVGGVVWLFLRRDRARDNFVDSVVLPGEDLSKLQLVSLVEESGRGQTSIVISEKGCADFLDRKVIDDLISNGRLLKFATAEITDENWQEISRQFIELLDSHGVRQASFVGVEDAGSIVQHLALTNLKRIRRIVLIDPATRAHPRLFDKITDWVEKKLPLGLPLRVVGKAFDSKPFLHRIRCPVLLVKSRTSNEAELAEIEFMSNHLPTAWMVDLSADNNDSEIESLNAAISEFQLVAAKRPRKAVA